jgi:hypothetical protein
LDGCATIVAEHLHPREDCIEVKPSLLSPHAARIYQVAGTTEADLQRELSAVVAQLWQEDRAILRTNQERQVKMHRFQLHRSAYLAVLEARWMQLSQAP